MTDEEFAEQVDAIRRKHAAIVPPDLPFLVDAGWLNVIDQALSAIEGFLRAEGWIEVARVRQIKEKFGGLRIYVRPDHEVDWPDEIAQGVLKIRDEFEGRSKHICEICGDPGEIRVIRHYHQCLCEHHALRRSEWAAAGSPDVDWR